MPLVSRVKSANAAAAQSDRCKINTDDARLAVFLRQSYKNQRRGLMELSRLNRLTTLHLNATSVSDRGLKHLAMIKSLRKLVLPGTSVTSEGVAELQNELPNCEIQH